MQRKRPHRDGYAAMNMASAELTTSRKPQVLSEILLALSNIRVGRFSRPCLSAGRGDTLETKTVRV